MNTENETILHRWFEEVWNKGRAEAIDELATPDAIVHGIFDAGGNEVRELAAFKAFHADFRRAFPGVQVTIEETVSEGDKVVGRCCVEATHTGQGLGLAPTQRKVDFTGMCMVRVKDGRIAEGWNSFDFLRLFQQLGVVGGGGATPGL